MSSILYLLFHGIGDTAFDVTLALLPIVVIFIVLQMVGLRLHKREFARIIFGFVIVYVGLILFLQGVHIAYLPVGTHIGEALASMENNWLLIPIGLLMGFLVAFAEPAVHVMVKQVEEMTSGAIKQSVLLCAISLGVALAVAGAMAKLLIGFSLWWVILPGYILVFILAKFVDPTFVAIAFDNGGVATGPMCSTFILALSVAVATMIPGRNPLLDGFGVVSMIALAPIITTMLLSFMYRRKADKTANKKALDTSGQSE